jgi:hypothetical protein
VKPFFLKPISKIIIETILKTKYFLLLDYNIQSERTTMSIRYYAIHVLEEYFTKFLKLKNSCSWMCRPGIQRTKVWLRSYIHGNLAWTTAPRGTRLCNSLSTSCRLTCAVTSLTSTPTCALTKTLTIITSPSSTSKHREFHVLEPRILRDFDSGVL